ncbi:hypothetical protein SPM24T3_19108 [Serratia sp. M24T3]|nr:hypothetical protein SPM24T3_19108 [Serratia sp. M24T3]
MPVAITRSAPETKLAIESVVADVFAAPKVKCSRDLEIAGANNTMSIAKIPHHAGEKLREELIRIKDTFSLMQ